MAQLKHPITGAVYCALDEGTVEVDSNGLKGIFRYDGEHLSGDLRFADPHMLLWLGGPQLPEGDNIRRNRGGGVRLHQAINRERRGSFHE